MAAFNKDEFFMREALKEAKKALQDDEVPIGAVIVCNNKIVARGYNQVERLRDATAHAEIIAITSASNNLGSKYLTDCTLYVTLEPCVMCAGAIFWSQLGKMIFGAYDEKRGYSLFNEHILHKQTAVQHGLLADESAEMLQGFFRSKRKG